MTVDEKCLFWCLAFGRVISVTIADKAKLPKHIWQLEETKVALQAEPYVNVTFPRQKS